MAPAAAGGPGRVRGRAAAGVFMVPRSPRPGRYIHACFRTRGARAGRAAPPRAAAEGPRTAPSGRHRHRHRGRCPGPRARGVGRPVRGARCPVPVLGGSPGWRRGAARLGSAGAQRSAPGSIFQPLPSYRGGAQGPHGPVPRPRPNNGERRSRGTSYGAAGAAAPGLSVTARISPAGGCVPARRRPTPCRQRGRAPPGCPRTPPARLRAPAAPAPAGGNGERRPGPGRGSSGRKGGAETRDNPGQLPARGGSGDPG